VGNIARLLLKNDGEVRFPDLVWILGLLIEGRYCAAGDAIQEPAHESPDISPRK
jgi:hypothetical protein